MKPLIPSKQNWITIEGWMVTNLGLKGDELIIFAIIYGFSQDRKSLYKGSTKYLSFWTGKTKETVLDNLKSLRQKRLIARIKKPSLKNSKRYFCDYYATITRVEPDIQEKLINNWSKYSPSLFPLEEE